MKIMIYAILLIGGTFTIILSLAALAAGGGVGALIVLLVGAAAFLTALKGLKL